MSYFAKPNYLIYDEWFDDVIEKKLHDLKNKKINTISNIHEFYYEQSNCKVGASENNLRLDKKVNEKEIIANFYLEKSLEKYTLLADKKFSFFNILSISKLKFNITKNLIYSLSFFIFLLIFGFVIFFISSSKQSESNTFISIEKEF